MQETGEETAQRPVWLEERGKEEGEGEETGSEHGRGRGHPEHEKTSDVLGQHAIGAE